MKIPFVIKNVSNFFFSFLFFAGLQTALAGESSTLGGADSIFFDKCVEEVKKNCSLHFSGPAPHDEKVQIYNSCLDNAVETCNNDNGVGQTFNVNTDNQPTTLSTRCGPNAHETGNYNNPASYACLCNDGFTYNKRGDCVKEPSSTLSDSITSNRDSLLNNQTNSAPTTPTSAQSCGPNQYVTSEANGGGKCDYVSAGAPEGVPCKNNKGETGNISEGFCESTRVQSLVDNEPGLISQEQSLCEESHQRATDCCTNPMSCVTGMDNDTGSLVGSIGTGVAGMLMTSGSSIQQSCKMMKAAGTLGAGLNAAAGGFCNAKRGECNNSCEGLKNKLKQKLVGECGAVINNSGTVTGLDLAHKNCGRRLVRIYHTAFESASTSVKVCQSLRSQENQMYAQATQSAFGAAMSDLCKNQADSNTDDGFNIGEKPTDFASFCSLPSNATSPSCRCFDPATKQNKPGCDPFGKATENSFASTTAFSSGNTDSGSTGKVDLGDDPSDGLEQGPLFGAGGAEKAEAGGVPANGGGFGGGSGGGGGGNNAGGGGGGNNAGGGGGGNNAGGGGGGGGYNTDVLNGLSGGGGYTGGGGFGGAGGWSGYNGKGGSGQKPNGFDLKQFLPGRQKDPTRKLAGLNGALRPDLGPPSSDIFQRITNRVNFLCIGDRLLDCPTRGGARAPNALPSYKKSSGK